MPSLHNPIIVALDLADADAAFRLAATIAPLTGALKVGSELFTAAGPDFVRRLRGIGANVFLDLKFHDIPNTVAKAVAAATALDVQMLTVHTSGGAEMLRTAREAAANAAHHVGRTPPLLLGVTVLTSMNAAQLATVTLETDVARHVERLAHLGVESGLTAFVCSPLELPVLRRSLPPATRFVTPGIRTSPPASGDDQKRTLGPREALAAGAHWIVVGRPIYAAPDPVAAIHELQRLISATPA